MKGLLSAAYSAVVYLLFFSTFLYLIGFVENLVVPKTIDGGAAGPLWPSLIVDLGLVALFGLQHSIMARPGFKRAWTRITPESSERSTFVLAASLAVIFLCWQWRALPGLVWSVDEPVAAAVLRGVSWAGWGMVLLSTFLINHFHLFGLSQGFARLIGRAVPEPQFTTPLFYKWVRHPLYTGFLLAFWAAPQMSLGHLVFAVGMTGYILVGILFEERDLLAQFGTRYLDYRERTGMLLPRLRSRPNRARPEVG
jgi:methanethiol S-methyltransferase